MQQQSPFLNSLRKELSLTVLALLIMLLQLFFSTAHLAAQAHGDDGMDRTGQALAFWEICTGQGIATSPATENGSVPHGESVDCEDCAICSSAAMGGFLAFDGDLPFVEFHRQVKRLPRPLGLEVHIFQLFPRAGSSRAPPVV